MCAPVTYTYRYLVLVIISRHIGYSNFLCHGKLTNKSPHNVHLYRDLVQIIISRYLNWFKFLCEET